ncbi:ATP-binding cassette domain-containing protein [Paenibacillus sp. SI8]|uniref:ABC transporter ATP-binding protein n=1 Tax=Paenibacillus sp. SI8 TaxID=3163026 RepID=UPI003466E57D
MHATINTGDRIAVLGPSGQGKSTLLRTMARLELIEAGSLTLHGRQMANWLPNEWRKKVCYVPQLPAMLPVTVADNLAMASKLHQSGFDQKLATALMEQVGLAELDWRHKAAELSGGQKQRVQLVRSLLLRPDILLLDEVTSALDVQSKQAVETLLAGWSEQEGTSFVWVTHDQEQARHVCRRLWHLENGELSEVTADVEAETIGSSLVRAGGEDPCLH